MYALKDLLKSATSSLSDSLASTEKLEREARANLDTAQLRAHAAREGMSARRPVLDVKEKARQTIIEKIRQLEAQLDAFRAEKAAAEAELAKCQQEQAAMQRDEGEAAKAGDEARKRLQALASKKSATLQDLNQARVGSVLRYLDEMASRLRAATELPSRTAERRRNLERLRQQRGRDPRVGELCEAREEWQKVLQTIKVPAVREKARADLDRIEKEIEELFPGALQAEADQELHDLEELYIVRQAARQLLLLPIESACWAAMQEGRGHAMGDFAVALAWSLLAGLDLNKETAEFVLLASGRVAVATPADLVLEERQFKWVLGEEADVTFLLSRFPAEIEEALNAANPTR